VEEGEQARAEIGEGGSCLEKMERGSLLKFEIKEVVRKRDITHAQKNEPASRAQEEKGRSDLTFLEAEECFEVQTVRERAPA